MKLADILTGSRIVAAPVVVLLIVTNRIKAAYYLFAAEITALGYKHSCCFRLSYDYGLYHWLEPYRYPPSYRFSGAPAI